MHMKCLTRARQLAFAAGVASLAVVAFGPAQSALAASPAVVAITGVAFSGTTASPTVTLTGTGFGTKPTNGVAVSALKNCPGGPYTGTDYPNAELAFSDPTTVGNPWSSGASNGHTGACIGVFVSSWSGKKIVFTFGSAYANGGGGGYVLTDGDPYVVAVKGIFQTGGSVSGL